MKLRLHKEQPTIPSSFGITWALMGLVFVGAALSIHLTTDSRWMEWHLSRLGEGGHLSSAIFNFTMGVIAVLFAVISTRLAEELYQTHRRAKIRTMHGLFIVAAICCIGVASFPFDAFPIIHNVFGHGGALAIILCMIGLPWLYPHFPRSVYYVGVFAALVVAILFATYLMTGKVTLLTVELIAQVLFSIWLLVLTHQARHVPREI